MRGVTEYEISNLPRKAKRRLFLLYFFTYPFPTVRSLSPHSTINSLHIFPPLSLSLFPVPSCLWPANGCPAPVDVFRPQSKGKAVPLQAWTGTEGSRKLRFPDFVTMVQVGGRMSALCTGRFYLQEIILVLISVRGWVDPTTIVFPHCRAAKIVCPCCRLKQPATRTLLKPSRTKSPTHSEQRTKRPM